ncbi:hypothetical protein Tco_0228453 [Tanacetum coccineum]
MVVFKVWIVFEKGNVRDEECMDADGDKFECDRSRNMGINRSNEGDKKDTEQRGMIMRILKALMIFNSTNEISEEGGDIVIFDEALVEKDSAQ